MSSASVIEAKLEAESKAFQLLQKGTSKRVSHWSSSVSFYFYFRTRSCHRVKTTFRVTTTRKRACQHCKNIYLQIEKKKLSNFNVYSMGTILGIRTFG